MAFERLRDSSLDYMPCRYGTSRLQFRGPKRQLAGDYAAFLGGTETYGKFLARPFPALIEAQTGVTCINLGWPNAGVDVFLNDAGLLDIAARARAVVLQVPPAQNMSNRFYRVHPRRNDRFLRASAMMKTIFRELDFTEFHFTRHMLSRVREAAPDRFGLLREELQTAWSARMRLLLDRIEVPVVLLWLSRHAPADSADRPDLAQDPAFVTRVMLEDLRGQVTRLIEVAAAPAALDHGTRGMVFGAFEAEAAGRLLGPAVHEQAAEALAPVVAGLVTR